MGSLGKKLEEIFTAASFAEAGDLDTAAELAAGERKVLLVMTGREADVKSLKYALNTAKRTDADLEVLMTADSQLSQEVLQLGEKEALRQSIPMRVARKTGCIRKSILDHTRNRRDLVCVVVESTEALNIDCSGEDRKLGGIWHRLGCPLALVSEKLD